MMISTKICRSLGTMIVYGFPKADLEIDLAIAGRIGAEVVEILPDWRAFPDPIPLRKMAEDRGLKIHSAHGCWGGQSIEANRVDLATPDSHAWAKSLDDLYRCIDWLESAGGSCLVVHPGGLSDAEETATRRHRLLDGLRLLGERALNKGVTICVENMPPGVFPGSRMIDLRAIVEEVDLPAVGLALDTGHANISASAGSETLEAGPQLRTTHVHDNDGRQDTHLPPGLGTIDWGAWVETLDTIGYRGPIMLECIKHLREKPASLTPEFLEGLRRMCGLERL
jgi:sugar phosphate isomerase/epimerase